MSKQCRLCAKFTESAIDLFLEHENTLLTNINSFLPINISKAKGLPSKICCKCVDRSNATHSFIQEVLLAQEVFGIDTGASSHMAGGPTNSVMYGGITISSTNQTTINVPSTTNKRNHKKVQNVSETLKKLKKMQTGNLTISKTIVQGPKPMRKCKKEPKTYNEYGDESDADVDRFDDEDNDPNFDGGNGGREASDSDNDDDDDDEDYKPLSSWIKASKKYKQTEPVQKLNDNSSSPFDAKTADTNPKFKSLKMNAPPVFLCMKCKNRFESLIALKQHVFQKNSCSYTQLTCNVCNKTFENKKRMTQHMKSHEEKVKFICDQCGKIYMNQFNLENHKSAQHGEYVDEHQNVYKCRLCCQKFTNRTDLYTHMKNHSSDNVEMLCDTCGKCFKNNHNLKTHMRTHLDIRPFDCTFCPKKFRTRLLLKQHLHVHTGIKEFQCTACSTLFAKRDSLRRHMRKQHPDFQPSKSNDEVKDFEVPANIIEKPSNGDSNPDTSIPPTDLNPNHSKPIDSTPVNSMDIDSTPGNPMHPINEQPVNLMQSMNL